MYILPSLPPVPDGAPVNVQSSSTRLDIITVTWDPPLTNLSNGLITGYTVQYRTVPSTNPQYTNTTALSITLDIDAGNTYLISVAAHTAIGLGPYSDPELVQMTIPVPVMFPSDPLTVSDGLSANTIPFTLPATNGDYRCVWMDEFH